MPDRSEVVIVVRTTGGAGGPIVAGVDGSSGSRAALAWAVSAARTHGVPVELVTVVDFAPYVMTGGVALRSEAFVERRLRADAEQLVDGLVAQVRSTAPDVAVSGRVLLGAASAVLAGLGTATPTALVVGETGHHGFPGLHLGSVGQHLAGRVSCPLVVTPADWSEPDDDRPVVVGVDGSAASTGAIAFAVREAVLRRVPLYAVHAWSVPPVDLVPSEEYAESQDRAARRLLAECLAGAREDEPALEVRERIVRDHPVTALVKEAADAALLVVGSRGHGTLAGLLLGSVSHSVLRHARCPVAVVRRTDSAAGAARVG